MLRILPALIFAISSLIPSKLGSQIIPADTNPGTSSKLKKDNSPVKEMVNKNFILHVKKSTGEIILDGEVNEADWANAEKTDKFFMVLPYDTCHSVARSDVMMTYDDKAFYVAMIAYDTLPGKRPVESLRHDFAYLNNDNIGLYLDTFNDQTNGYCFGVNAAGAIRDGAVSDGKVNNQMWDCKWESKTKNFPDRWVTEMRIPFKSVRYKAGSDQWNVQFARYDMKLNEKSAWAPIPRQFPAASLAYAGRLQWDTPPPDPGLKLSLIPYLLGSTSRDNEEGEETKFRKEAGFDAKINLSSSLNLDLTLNPDFSQAEVDEQVTNLERYELYFPEKRQFFLENSDLFASFGSSEIRPFFSRRIGIDAPVAGGIRLSGKIGRDWRIGLMDMQTGNEDDLPARNFFVTSLEKKVFARSNLAVIMVNKQNINTPSDWQGNRYNRMAGFEYNLASRNDFWTGKFFGLKSFSPNSDSSEEYAQGSDITYSRKSLLVEFREYYVGNNFNAEAGYVPRTDFIRLNPEATIKFYPKNSSLEYHGPQIGLDNYFHPADMKLSDSKINLNYQLQFNNRAHLELITSTNQVMLRKDYDPTNQGNHFLPLGSNYNWTNASVLFTSDNLKLIKYGIQSGYGGFYNGDKWFVSGNINYRYEPFGYISLTVSYNDLFLPQPWGRTGFLLLGTKLDITFTPRLFLTTYVQYNEQADNLNINTRFQWRYKPLSDLFIVYTDNYFPETMNSKKRALMLKISYWFN